MTEPILEEAEKIQAEIVPEGAPDHSADHREVAREGGWAGIINLLGAAIRYGNNIILTRMLGPKFYGLYALANQVVTVVTVPASLGLPTSMVHFIASSASTGAWGRLRWVVRAAFLAAVVSSLVGMGLIIGLAPWASETLFQKKGLLPALVGLAIALPFLVFYAICAGGLQGLKQIRAKVIIERIAHPLIFSLLLVAGWFTLSTLPFVLGCFVAAAFAVSVISAFWFRKKLREVPRDPGHEAAHWRELLAFSTPVMFMNLLSLFVLRSDIFVMGVFRPAAEVGVYSIAWALAQGVSMPTDALGASLAPSFSGLMGKGDLAALRRLFHTSTRWLFLMGCGVGLALTLAGPLILHLFGKDFRDGFVVLCILAAGQMFSATLGANGTLITMTGHPKINLVNSFFLGLGNLGLGLLLVPRFGGPGAAAAAAASLVTVNLARALEIWLILKIGPWDRTILKPILIVLTAVLLGSGAFYAFGPWAGAPVGLLSFASMWLVLKPEPEDADLLRRALAKVRSIRSGAA